ncbi:MAG TPA: hypothetical protein VIU61_07290, partial [Kofleriaceae bacterium]
MRLVACPALALALAACSSPPAPEPIAGRPTTRPESPTDSTLVMVEPDGAQCVVRRRDPVTQRADELARLPGDCYGARLAWRTQLDRFVVWFQPGNVHSAGYGADGAPRPNHPDEDERQIRERAFEVELAGGAVKPVALPAADRAHELAYAASGTLYLFSVEELPKATGKVSVRGTLLDFTDLGEGIPAAALAFKRTTTGWELASVTRTTTGWDYAAGWGAAPEARGLGPRSFELLDSHADTSEISDRTTKAALDAIAKPNDDRDGWLQVVPGLYAWQITGEFSYTTGRIAWGTGHTVKLLPELGFSAGELVAIRTRGTFLLVAGAHAGAYPRLYDLQTKKLVFQSETARAVTFWPTASSSGSAGDR